MPCGLSQTNNRPSVLWEGDLFVYNASVFLGFSKGCRGGALGCLHYFPFCV